MRVALKPSLPGAFVAVVLLTCVGCEQHRSVSKQMGWQCTGVVDTADRRFPHIEGVKLWFRENPHYEERASGPSLCADLERFHQPHVTVTFDVWGTRLQGTHGYNLVSITVGSTPLTVFGAESGGVHGDPAGGDVGRIPIDVF